jgi:hypothetical protein
LPYVDHEIDEGPTDAVVEKDETAFRQVVIAGLIGVGVALLCVIFPIIHFVTGPLAPGIGGFVAGIRTGASGTETWLIGGTIGLGLAIILGVATLVISALIAGGRPLANTGALVGGAALVYGTLLGTLGATLGGRMGRAG